MFKTNKTKTLSFTSRFVDAVTIRPFLDDLHRMSKVRQATADLIEFRRDGVMFQSSDRAAA